MAVDALPGRVVEVVVGGGHVAVLRLAAALGRDDRVQHRGARRHILVGLVGVPERRAVADFRIFVALLRVAHRHQLRVPGHAHVIQNVGDRNPPLAPETQVLVLVEPLVLDDDDAVGIQRIGQHVHQGIADSGADVDTADLGPENGIEGGNRRHSRLRTECCGPTMDVTPGEEPRQGRENARERDDSHDRVDRAGSAPRPARRIAGTPTPAAPPTCASKGPNDLCSGRLVFRTALRATC